MRIYGGSLWVPRRPSPHTKLSIPMAFTNILFPLPNLLDDFFLYYLCDAFWYHEIQSSGREVFRWDIAQEPQDHVLNVHGFMSNRYSSSKSVEQSKAWITCNAVGVLWAALLLLQNPLFFPYLSFSLTLCWPPWFSHAEQTSDNLYPDISHSVVLSSNGLLLLSWYL